METPIDVHVWFDIACPWCFIGKRRFEQAVRLFDGEVRVEYHSYELAPDTPVDFEGNEIDFLAGRKHMPRGQVQAMLGEMTELAASEGLHYDFSAVHHTKTLLAHQLVHHAKAQGKQVEMVERLLQAYFEQGRHVGRIDELVALAGEVGLDPVETRQVLADGVYAPAVQADLDAARQMGIDGVPFYAIDGRYAVSGAQNPDVFLRALTRADEERRTTSV